MNKNLLVVALFCCSVSFAVAQDSVLYEKKLFVSQGDTMPYRLLLPDPYDQHKKYPLILFMHGSGEKGNNNVTQLVHGGSVFTRDSIRRLYPAIVVIPQCARSSNWVNDKREKDSSGKYSLTMPPNAPATRAMQLVQELLTALLHEYPVDKKRLYVGGLSLGGMGTYDIVQRNPRMFAGAFPMAGAANAALAPRLKYTHWWIFHGDNDKAVPPEFDKQLVSAMQQLNIPLQFTLYPNTGHNSWDKAFDEPGLFNWLFSNRKK